jgi:phosphatidylglycerophosphatase C
MDVTPANATRRQIRGDPMPRMAPLTVVFDFDHTLYDGDSGSHMVRWLLARNPLRMLVALLASPVLLPMLAWLPTRRRAVSGYFWIGTFGLHEVHDFDALVERYVLAHADEIHARLLLQGMETLREHRVDGDRVVVATGAPPVLARQILAAANQQDVPVIGSVLKPCCGGLIAARHCHAEVKVAMLAEAGITGIDRAYSDSLADLPLLLAAAEPVVVNPKHAALETFCARLPAGTPMLNWGCTERSGERTR